MNGDHRLGADLAAIEEIRFSLGEHFGVTSQEFDRLRQLSQHIAPHTLLYEHAALTALLTQLSMTLSEPSLREALAQILRWTSLGRSMQLIDPESL